MPRQVETTFQVNAISGKNYRLEPNREDLSRFTLAGERGTLVAELLLLSSCNTLDGLDRCTGIDRHFVENKRLGFFIWAKKFARGKYRNCRRKSDVAETAKIYCKGPTESRD